MKNLLILSFLFFLYGCDNLLKRGDSELRAMQQERNKAVMLEYGQLVLPKDIESIPLEKDSQYTPPADERGVVDKFMDNFR